MSNAADPGGGGSGSGEGAVTTWIAIGLAVGLGILFTLDILSDSGDDSVGDPEELYRGDPEVAELVDWDTVSPPVQTDGEAQLPKLAVVSFGIDDGYSLAASYIDLLERSGSGAFELYPEPLELGSMALTEAAGVASSFYGCDQVIYATPLSDDSEGIILELAVASGATIWADTLPMINPQTIGESATRLVIARTP
jgi:hypothetical protein